jgi:signal transduction histidine kinase
MIRTRWLVVVAVLVVGAIGALEYDEETDRSEAGLRDLGRQQRVLAEAALLALDNPTVDTIERARETLGSLQAPGTVITIGNATVDGRPLPREVWDAIAAGDDVIRVDREVAPALGLPARTAMMGVARGLHEPWVIGVASTAEGQRDRDREGRRRMLVSILLAAAVMSACAAVVWAKQRSEAKLARELAIAEAAHARDAELERLNRAATMAALGSGVAHELSTPLGVIVGRAEQLVARATDERTVKAAHAIIEQADYIDRVVRGLLGLARGAPIALEDVAPETVVADTFALVRHRFERKGVELVPTVEDHIPAIRCEPLLLRHALVNLLLNACDASKPGATVELDVRATDASVTFVVTDEGDGIAADDIARAVEPFFTTKPIGQGTGLGLAIANEIAKSHRGSLELAPRETRGTRASITIPREPCRS